VLAEQHAATFKERLQGFPVTVDCLDRFRSSAEQKQILKNLVDGRIDIIIGTHRILSKDVVFKRLGLLIIDEEHRFGVSHKERLKMLRTGIDVLTLTATPIPRTLQMSLLGVRDLSVINTPPVNRQSVKTFIAKYSDLIIKEAVIRELQRGGQVFLVHNRVHSIHELAFKVQKLVPEAKIAVAHGQMAGKILEEIMVRFVRREVNVLICTTIIESGLDIPNANTIIINRADRMGLAEIYQLRGRVGRSKEQAYAYLLVPSLELLSKDAKQRLRALMDYNELGGGFKLALSDLQIRGGGNILGESQSGTIAAVGYDLYLDLLQRTVEDLKQHGELGDGGPSGASEIDPEINLKVSAFIPEEYIPDLDQRYIAYRRIASVSSEDEARDLQEEFTDRYGHLPPATLNLFGVVTLKLELKKLRISKLEAAPEALVFSFAGNTPASPERILLYVEHHKKKARLTPDGRLVVRIPSASTESIFETVRKILHSLG
jgi:transcription-repair coupling factor (superfamily II helicase)